MYHKTSLIILTYYWANYHHLYEETLRSIIKTNTRIEMVKGTWKHACRGRALPKWIGTTNPKLLERALYFIFTHVGMQFPRGIQVVISSKCEHDMWQNLMILCRNREAASIQTECGEYQEHYVKYCQSHKTLSGIWIMFQRFLIWKFIFFQSQPCYAIELLSQSN